MQADNESKRQAAVELRQSSDAKARDSQPKMESTLGFGHLSVHCIQRHERYCLDHVSAPSRNVASFPMTQSCGEVVSFCLSREQVEEPRKAHQQEQIIPHGIDKAVLHPNLKKVLRSGRACASVGRTHSSFLIDAKSKESMSYWHDSKEAQLHQTPRLLVCGCSKESGEVS